MMSGSLCVWPDKNHDVLVHIKFFFYNIQGLIYFCVNPSTLSAFYLPSFISVYDDSKRKNRSYLFLCV